MTDEIRIYHVDDPNDAPDRRLSAFPTLNPSIPTSLPQYVIPPVANSLYTAFQYYWYSAYQQGIAAQKQQQQHQQLISNTQDHHNRYHIQSNHHHHHHHQHHQHQHHQHQHPHPHPQQHPNRHHQVVSPSSSIGLTGSSSSSSSSSASSSTLNIASSTLQKQQHIKKPLNPFMIYMQKRRPEIVKRGDIKESAAINQFLGQEWRKMSREEQEPYYKLAEQEKILHAQKYPGWSARDNYANQKKRKKLKIKSRQEDQSDKKCRARFGLCNMASWCKPCRRKKKCIYNQ